MTDFSFLGELYLKYQFLVWTIPQITQMCVISFVYNQSG